MRVGFAFFQLKSAVFVLAMFAKNDSANFTAAERKALARLLKETERNFR
jgi:hypothetical protein